ncbi:hypothetical protein ACFQ9X_22110 [Catenulispora yoronensis]
MDHGVAGERVTPAGTAGITDTPDAASALGPIRNTVPSSSGGSTPTTSRSRAKTLTSSATGR